MDFLGGIVVIVVVFLMGFVAVLRWNEVKYGKKGLPPGTMGWPALGETAVFFRQGTSFMQSRRER